MSDRSLRPLLPAPSQSSSSSGVLVDGDHPVSDGLPKRIKTSVACDWCRRKKAKCDGCKPKCTRCTTRSLPCSYEDENPLVNGDGPSESQAVKRKYASIRDESQQLHDLYDMLRTRTESEAYDIFSRIRRSSDPLDVLRYVKDAELLLPNNNSAEAVPLRAGEGASRIALLNSTTLQASPIKVHARPWTDVAGDGVVSDLISSFFAWDAAFFYCFVDQECFLADMARGEPGSSRYCSPMLVNAICALRCWTSEPARRMQFYTNTDLANLFFDSSKRHLEHDEPEDSIPTIQALKLMFTYCAYTGKDRTAYSYRTRACDMLKRMRLDEQIARLPESEKDSGHVRWLSTAVWGVYSFESILANVYMQKSLIAPPTVPRVFARLRDVATDKSGNVDVAGWPMEPLSSQPPLVTGTLDAVCDLSLMLYEAMQLAETHDDHGGSSEIDGHVGIQEDLERRQDMLAKVDDYQQALPKMLSFQHNFVPQTCFIGIYADQVRAAILRPLPHATVLRPYGMDAASALVSAMTRDITLLERYNTLWPTQTTAYSSILLCSAYSTLLTLLTLLREPNAPALFERAARLLRTTAHDYPFARYILQGLWALASSLRSGMPPPAIRFLEDLGEFTRSQHRKQQQQQQDQEHGQQQDGVTPKGGEGELPVPQAEEIRDLITGRGGETARELGREVAELLRKWAQLSLDG